MTKHLLIALMLCGLISGLSARAQETAAPRSAATVPDGINERFKDPQLDVNEWLERFEVESREVYTARDAVLEACAVQQGEKIADVGAGTGFYSQLFAKRTGDNGWVYSVDIAPKFLQHIASRATTEGIAHLTPVLGTDTSIRLPAESLDLVFVCDTSRDWILDHVRAGKESFREEIESAGFQYVDEVDIEEFEENYLIRFTKPTDGN